MVDIYDIKEHLEAKGIHDIRFAPLDESIEFYLPTPYGETLRFWIDLEGKFLECSCYAFPAEKNARVFNLLNDYNNYYQMLKLSITGRGNIRAEFDLLKDFFNNPEIVVCFISLSALVLEKLYDDLN